MFRAFISAAVVMWAWGASVGADTLVMRDGRRLHGSLVSVSRGTVVFEEDRGTARPRQVRARLDEVDRIELRDTLDDDEDPLEPEPGPDEVTTRGGDRDEDMAGPRDDQGGRRRTIEVTGSEPWTDTGLEVRPGQELYFSPEGSLIWSAGHRDGPGGDVDSPHDNRRPIPGRPGGALIGRIGSGRDYFFIGTDRGPYRVRAPGRLFLGINDDYFEDNSGAFRVIVSY
jgi:hypothetical protein